jgi:hypothetical protein
LLRDMGIPTPDHPGTPAPPEVKALGPPVI